MDYPNNIKAKVLPELIQLLSYYSRKIRYAKNSGPATSETVGLIESCQSELVSTTISETDLAGYLRQLISNLQNLGSNERSGIYQDMLEELTLFQLRHGLEQKN